MHRVTNYEAVLQEKITEHLQIRSQLSRILLIRLLSFALIAMAAWQLANIHYGYSIGAVVAGLAFFLMLVKRNERLKFQKEFNETYQSLLEAEILAQKGDHSRFNTGAHFHELDHAYGHDLDIFGSNSFFQSLDRTSTSSGAESLADHLKDYVTYETPLKDRQDILIELADKADFRQKMYVFGQVYGSEKDEIQTLIKWREVFKPYVHKSVFWTIYRFAIPLISFGALALNIMGVISVIELIIWLMVPLMVTGSKIKLTNQVHGQASLGYRILSKASSLLKEIESEEFKHPILKEKSAQVGNEDYSSAEIEKLSKIMSSFDNRMNPFVGIVLNAFMAWDFMVLNRLEKWMAAHSGSFESLYDHLAWWDVQNSMGTYVYNHPTFNFPNEGAQVLKAQQLGHPFLPEDVCVRNDFDLKDLSSFAIITGANMAGKSTFLRSTGLSLVMAKLGLPVCAESYEFQSLKIFTSMRTTDSLQDNESYFYTELKRLKALMTKLEKGEKLFIILDEILKGTNSKDKAEGSKRFVRKLLDFQVAGIIATHDLSLTSLGNEIDGVQNVCFEVEFGTDDLIFDYTLKPGVCKNMNATWLLEKMELVN